MEGLRQYVLQLTIAALSCGIINVLVKESSFRDIIKFICGLFLAMTALRPLTRIDLALLDDWSHQYSENAAEAVSAGENFARDATADIIKAECEAYILDKAAELETQVTVTVTLSDDSPPIPVAVFISGKVTPYVRLRLEEMIQQDLGITKENQLWTG